MQCDTLYSNTCAAVTRLRYRESKSPPPLPSSDSTTPTAISPEQPPMLGLRRIEDTTLTSARASGCVPTSSKHTNSGCSVSQNASKNTLWLSSLPRLCCLITNTVCTGEYRAPKRFCSLGVDGRSCGANSKVWSCTVSASTSCTNASVSSSARCIVVPRAAVYIASRLTMPSRSAALVQSASIFSMPSATTTTTMSCHRSPVAFPANESRAKLVTFCATPSIVRSSCDPLSLYIVTTIARRHCRRAASLDSGGHRYGTCDGM
mmetsp:Transcript_17060/g.59810  ORF Transcript_17060/g.59810 Transcript_17060/m.59810 type:complete len:262 (+) Transcript_17060:1829-2614(+)